MEKKEHPQAKWLRAIADGELIQFQDTQGSWHGASAHAILTDLVAGISTQLRIKPRTITIGKYEVAEPIKEEPNASADYFYLDAAEPSAVCPSYWAGDRNDRNALASGMCWLKREDAELAAKAISELLTGKT